MSQSRSQIRSNVMPFLALGVIVAITSAARSLPPAMAGNAQSASGHANMTVNAAGLPDPNGELRTFSFTATKQSDGTVKGEAHVKNRAQDVVLHMEVDCLKIDGKTALVSGKITKCTTGSLVGRTGFFGVQDNGEGSKSNPDKVTNVFQLSAGVGCQRFTAASIRTQLMSIEGGNIQVKP